MPSTRRSWGKLRRRKPGAHRNEGRGAYRFSVGPSESRPVRLRLQRIKEPAIPAFDDFDRLVAQRRKEADEFYGALTPSCLSSEQCAIQRQALAGMLWTKQFYYYVVEQWLEGDPAQPPPPAERKTGRNAAGVISTTSA